MGRAELVFLFSLLVVLGCTTPAAKPEENVSAVPAVVWHDNFSSLKKAYDENAVRSDDEWSALWWQDFERQEELMAAIQNSSSKKEALRTFLKAKLKSRSGSLPKFLSQSGEVSGRFKQLVSAAAQRVGGLAKIEKPIDAHLVMYIHPFDAKEFVGPEGPAFAVNLAYPEWDKRKQGELEVLLAHEIFHVVHLRHAGDALLNTNEGIVMREGLAVLATAQLYAGDSDADYAFMPEGDVKEVKANLKEICADMLRDLKLSPSEYNLRYFSQTKRKWPARSGYLIGYLLLKRKLSTSSVQELVTLQTTQLPHVVREGLAALAQHDPR